MCAGDFDKTQIRDIGYDASTISIEKHHLHFCADTGHGRFQISNFKLDLRVLFRTLFTSGIRNSMILVPSQHVCGTRTQLFLLAGVILILHAGSAAATEGSLKFGGVALSPGSMVKANVPLSTQEKSLAAQGGNPVPPNAVAVLATPANFDPRKSWPVLVTCSTSDFKRQNRDDLIQFYRTVGLSEGWVLLAGDGPQHARNDTAAWRGAMTLAAIDALHRSFSGSEKWPVACAGFSGGGKGVGYVAPL